MSLWIGPQEGRTSVIGDNARIVGGGSSSGAAPGGYIAFGKPPSWSPEVLQPAVDVAEFAQDRLDDLNSMGMVAPGASSTQPANTTSAEEFVAPPEPEANSDGTPSETSIQDALEGGWSLSAYMQSHPGASYESIMREASLHSDEWAEKYLDYLTERGELDRANEYTANREDTAYQRLVQDLRKAGINPALMYGSGGNISASGSQGYIKMSEGANSRTIGNYSKLKQLMLGVLSYELSKALGIANTTMNGVKTIFSILTPFL